MSREMIDSGIDWIGRIPSSWDIQRVKQVFTYKKGKAKQSNPVILSLARDGIRERDVSNNEGQIAASYFDYNPVEVGDFLLNPMDLYSGANCNVSTISGVISPAYANLRYRLGYNPFYFDYYFKVQYWHMAMFAHGKGVSFDHRWTLNRNDLMNYWLPVPSAIEQDKIVDMLSFKTSQIDQLIVLQEQQIEKLKEYKQSVISKAVTKGLDPNASMKDSGIEWLGPINSTFTITKLLNVLSMKITDGPHETPELHSDGIPFISAEAVHDGFIDFTKPRGYISEDYYKYCCEKYVPKLHDIYMVKSGATTGTLAIVETEDTFTIWSPLAVIRANENIVLYKYLYYIMYSTPFQEQITIRWNFGTQQNIGMRVVETLRIFFPKVGFQQAIINYLDNQLSKIDQQMKSMSTKIEKLQEYKKSLIYEYVTGKKQVV